MHIAIDIGYSAVKAVSETGNQIIFPLVIAPTDEGPLNGLFKSGVDHRVLVRNWDSKTLPGGQRRPSRIECNVHT